MISAIILAAGQSIRMGQPKMLMPWGKTTVIGKVVSTVREAGLNDIHVVTGGNRAEIQESLKSFNIVYIYNNEFTNGEMLTSLQVGLGSLGDETEAVLIVLGDQPQIEAGIIEEVLERYSSTHQKIIVPSYKMHRGHPWLVEKTLWQEILNLRHPETLRNFLNANNKIIDYVKVNSQSVIQDLDTQSDYSQYKP
jgi:molybdenum cofactor cytidylyltransferase